MRSISNFTALGVSGDFSALKLQVVWNLSSVTVFLGPTEFILVMAGRGGGSPGQDPGIGGPVLKQLVQTLRGDLNLLSNEARKKYPAVREVREGR